MFVYRGHRVKVKVTGAKQRVCILIACGLTSIGRQCCYEMCLNRISRGISVASRAVASACRYWWNGFVFMSAEDPTQCNSISHLQCSPQNIEAYSRKCNIVSYTKSLSTSYNYKSLYSLLRSENVAQITYGVSNDLTF